MSEAEWARLVRTPGAQARHQALELLTREWYAAEWTMPDRIALHRWAVAVLAGETATRRRHER
jgi:hypothetical protein